MSNKSALLIACLALPAVDALAGQEGLAFYRHDWEITCDNTRTCRAAGYQNHSSELRASVLLTRQAGPNAPVTGQLMLGSYGDEDEKLFSRLPQEIKLTMRINGRNLGQVVVSQESLTAKLSEKQLAALLASLKQNATLEWSQDENIWQISDQGAAAVLLKMDEFQGRIGTPGALVRKGNRREDSVLAPLPVPTIVSPPLAKPRPEDALVAAKPALRKALVATLEGVGDCPQPLEAEGEVHPIEITRLSESKLLASTRCWQGAYNAGYGYWVIDDKPPFHPALVTTLGTDFSEGSISAAHKGRGLGDCWSSDSWTWDGRKFVHTKSSTTGMCRLIAPGGAWSLPQIIYNIGK